MKADFWEKLKKRQKETAEIPLQDFGRFSLSYRHIASYFKTLPWRILFFFSILGTIFMIYFLRSSFVRLAEIIGGGF